MIPEPTPAQLEMRRRNTEHLAQLRAEQALRDRAHEIPGLEARWQSLKDWLAAECEHDHSVMESFRDYPDDGAVSKAHGALLSAKRSVLSKMRELES